jgi:putative acetyltransferase
MTGSKIEALFLHPEFHRQGGGRRLVRHAQELHGELTTDVNETSRTRRLVGSTRRAGSSWKGGRSWTTGGRPFPLLHLRLAAPNPALYPTGGA